MVDESEAYIESVKAVQEVAKTSGKAIDMTRDLGNFIAQFITGPLEQGAGIVEDKLYFMRLENRIRFMEKVNKLMDGRSKGTIIKPISLKLAIPLFQAAFLENDDYLQDLWANLLVNASTDDGMELRRAYIDILERLSPMEALILQKIYVLPPDVPKGSGIVTGGLPDIPHYEMDNRKGLVEPNDEVKMALANLARLGCISLPTEWLDSEKLTYVNPTLMGESLVKALHNPVGNPCNSKWQN